MAGPDASSSRPRVVYATTREATYARNQTLVAALSRHADVEVIAPQGSGQGFDRRLAYLWGLVRVVARVLLLALRPSRRGDTLVMGFLAQPLAVALAPLWRGRLIGDAMISVFDTVCYDKQLARPGSIAGRAAWQLDAWLVRRADVLLFDTRAHRDYFAQFARPALPPSIVVPVGARPMRPAPCGRMRGDALQVVFAGSYIPLQGPGVIVEAAGLLADAPVDLTMIGLGQERAACVARARALGLERLRFIGWVDLETLDDWYHRADVVLGIFGTTPKTQRVIPNKVFEAVSIGRPVITGDTPAIREVFVPGRDVICCPVGDPAGLAAAVRWALAHRDEIAAIGCAGRDAFEAHASAQALASAVRPLFEEAGR